jgi:hypothetical protein
MLAFALVPVLGGLGRRSGGQPSKLLRRLEWILNRQRRRVEYNVIIWANAGVLMLRIGDLNPKRPTTPGAKSDVRSQCPRTVQIAY